MIQPKFKIGDTVFYASGGEIHKNIICGRKVEDYEKEIAPGETTLVESILYRCDKTVHSYLPEASMFSAVDQLIENLKDTIVNH